MNSSTNASVLTFDPDFDRTAPSSYFMNEINKVASHLASFFAYQRVILDDDAVRHFYLVNLAVFDAVYQSIEISSMPWWSTNGPKKSVVNIIFGSPFGPA
jgi:hypothetical protein